MLSRGTIRRRQGGATLMEVLVTLFVLSVGLLGFAGLLNKSLASNRDAYFRSQASILAHDLGERMRANRVGALAGSYSMSSKASASGTDAVDWVNLVATTLPAGDAAVNTSASGDSLSVTITLRWSDGRAERALTTQTAL